MKYLLRINRNKADKLLRKNLKEILKQDWEIDNRATWEDGTPVKTKRINMVNNKYDLSKEFPASTFRPLALRSCINEILWIYQKLSTYTSDLSSSVWDSWTMEDGTIGKSYGYQIGHSIYEYSSQIEYVLNEIQNNPSSRRIMMNMFNASESKDKALLECAYATHFTVKDGKLNMTLILRSNDLCVAGNWNVAQYAILTHMIAIHCGLEVGILSHYIQDLHIYNKHEDIALDLVSRKSHKAPVLWINPDKKDFFSFTEDDFKLINYKKGKQINNIDVAV